MIRINRTSRNYHKHMQKFKAEQWNKTCNQPQTTWDWTERIFHININSNLCFVILRAKISSPITDTSWFGIESLNADIYAKRKSVPIRVANLWYVAEESCCHNTYPMIFFPRNPKAAERPAMSWRKWEYRAPRGWRCNTKPFSWSEPWKLRQCTGWGSIHKWPRFVRRWQLLRKWCCCTIFVKPRNNCRTHCIRSDKDKEFKKSRNLKINF